MRSTIAHGKKRYQPNFRVHPDMDDEPNVGLYRPDRTFTPGPSAPRSIRPFAFVSSVRARTKNTLAADMFP